MEFRDFLRLLDEKGMLIHIKKPVSTKLEAAGIMHALEGKPLIFENVKGYDMKVVANVFSSRKLVAMCLNKKEEELVFEMKRAIENPVEPRLFEGKTAPCQEIVEGPSIRKLPILFHAEKDGGPYITSGVVFAYDEKYGRNMSFHRLMQIDERKFSVRILPRHLDAFLKKQGELDVAVCIGNSINVLLAGATSVELGFDEMAIANALERVETVKAKTVDVEIPANSEIVLEGRITKETAPEGKFVDITGTYDRVREQPVFEVRKITRRKDAIYHGLLPSGGEHKILMGLPREPTILREVGRVCECKNVYLTEGGCSWLHAVVQIVKKREDDGVKAIEAAFKGHSSLKRVVVVDEDIDIFNPNDVEWAIATRFQASKNLVIKPREKGSSLDPSADPITRETTKWGIDATMPLDPEKREKCKKAVFKQVRIEDYL
ncbi:MAG: UbiD family decarboxylase [Candidatus Micrarchaeia archaeon]